MKLIAICGNAGCGKDTAADHLVNNYSFDKISFAGPLKKFGKRVFDFTDDQLYGPSNFRNAIDTRYYAWNERVDEMWDMAEGYLALFGPGWAESVIPNYTPKDYHTLVRWFDKLKEEHPAISPRIMLQQLGTEWGRNIDKDIWVKAALRKARSLDKCVITDVRFFNELDLVKKAGGKLVRVHREETDDNASLLGMGNHQSEMELTMFTDDMFDAVINNNRSLNDFINSVDNIEHILFGDYND